MNGRSPLGDHGWNRTTPALVVRRVVNSTDIQVQRPSELRQAQLNAGIGERDELAAIAEGEFKQMDVLSIETTVRLQQFELALDRIFGFADSQSDVIAAALGNAHIFVPEMRDHGRACPSREPIPDGRFLDDVFGQSSQVATGSQPTPDPSAKPTRLCSGTPPSCGARWGWIQPSGLRVSLSCGAQ